MMESEFMNDPLGRGLPIVGLIIAIGLAAWLRLGYPGVNAFAFDEARLSLIALNMGREGQFATVGMPSSAGVPNMPAAAWIFALPYALNPDPLFASLTVGLIGVLAVICVWQLARPWGARAAFVAALVLAAHPFAVLYSRSVWAQNLLIPLTILWLLAAIRTTPDIPRRSRWIAVAIATFVTGFAFQVHFAGAALTLAGGYAFFRWRWWRTPLAVLVGGGLAILCALPFIFTPGAVRGLLGAAGGPSQIDLTAWEAAGRLIAGIDWRFLLHGDLDLPLTRITPTVMNIGLGGLLGLSVVLGILFVAADRLGIEAPPRDLTDDTSDDPQTSKTPLLELAIVVGLSAPLLFTRYSTPVFGHYLLPTLPAVALLLGWCSAKNRPKWLRNMVTVVALVFALGWTGQLIRALPLAGQVHTPNGLPEPLHTLRIAANTTPDDRPVLFFTHGDDPLTQGEPAIFRALWWERGASARIIDGRSVFILPPTPATLMFTERAFQAWEEARESDLLSDLVQIPRREGIAPFEGVSYDGKSSPNGFTLLDEPLLFEHGATLEGWRVYQVGPRTRISTLWTAPGEIGEAVHQFHHLRLQGSDAEQPLAVSDVSVRGHLWRDGDTVIVMGDFFDLEPEIGYTVDVGHYTLPDVTRIPTADSLDRVTLGPFELQSAEQ